ncbi:MAG TPA: response regulator [Cytophagaceae bacterium]|jgi:CheY-like chemotaxis protein|nr:response regulator [Cytophagaceae bacterium]
MNGIKSILIVDDDEINNFLHERLLRILKVTEQITIAINGANGIKCLEYCFLKNERVPDLILLDINMPVMDGFEFLKNFRAMNFTNKEKIIIAVLTTSSDPGDRNKMEALGVRHYLYKPLTEQAILRLMDHLGQQTNIVE